MTDWSIRVCDWYAGDGSERRQRGSQEGSARLRVSVLFPSVGLTVLFNSLTDCFFRLCDRLVYSHLRLTVLFASVTGLQEKARSADSEALEEELAVWD